MEEGYWRERPENKGAELPEVKTNSRQCDARRSGGRGKGRAGRNADPEVIN